MKRKLIFVFFSFSIIICQAQKKNNLPLLLSFDNVYSGLTNFDFDIRRRFKKRYLKRFPIEYNKVDVKLYYEPYPIDSSDLEPVFKMDHMLFFEKVSNLSELYKKGIIIFDTDILRRAIYNDKIEVSYIDTFGFKFKSKRIEIKSTYYKSSFFNSWYPWYPYYPSIYHTYYYSDSCDCLHSKNEVKDSLFLSKNNLHFRINTFPKEEIRPYEFKYQLINFYGKLKLVGWQDVQIPNWNRTQPGDSLSITLKKVPVYIMTKIRSLEINDKVKFNDEYVETLTTEYPKPNYYMPRKVVSDSTKEIRNTNLPIGYYYTLKSKKR